MVETLGTLIPIVAIICVFAVPVIAISIIIIKAITSDKKVRMELARQGIIAPQQEKTPPNRFRSLRNGFLCIGVALGLVVGLLLCMNICVNELEYFLILTTSTVLFLGVGYVAFYFFSKKESKNFDDNSIDSEIE